MIRTYNKQTVVVENGVTKYLADIFCNSTDTKPTANLVNGSKLTEVDTGKTFLYDEANTEWVEFAEGGGGSTGGNGGVGVISSMKYDGTVWGLKCSNPNALSFVLEYADGNDNITRTPITYYQLHERTDNILPEYNMVTYNEDGSTTPYTGNKTVITVAGVAIFNEGVASTLTPIADSTPEGGYIIDKETGKIVYFIADYAD